MGQFPGRLSWQDCPSIHLIHMSNVHVISPLSSMLASCSIQIAPRGSSFRLFHSPLIGSINIQVLGSSFPLFGSLDKYYIDCGGTSWPYPTCRVVLLTIILLHLFRWKLWSSKQEVHRKKSISHRSVERVNTAMLVIVLFKITVSK